MRWIRLSDAAGRNRQALAAGVKLSYRLAVSLARMTSGPRCRLARSGHITVKGMRTMRGSCLAVAILSLMASRADAAIIDWQAELQRCRALRENVAPLLQAGQGISAVGRSKRTVRRCIWIQRMAVRRKISGAETWERGRLSRGRLLRAPQQGLQTR